MFKTRAYLGWLIGAAILASLPLFLDSYYIRILVIANLYAIFAMSWDIFSGHTGYISFGHSFLIGTAGYTSALLNVHFGLPIYISIPVAILTTVSIGIALFFPALRLRGSYFTLMTLLFAVVAEKLARVFSGVTGGDRGLTPLPTIISGAIPNFYMTLAFMMIIGFGLWYISKSKMGFVFKAIMQKEDAVEGVGLNTTKFKLFSFLLSAIVASIGGCLWVHYMGSITPSILSLDMGVTVLIAAIIGGIGTIIGPIGGGYLMLFITEALRPFLPSAARMLLYGSLGVIIFLWLPKGLMPKLTMEWGKLWNRIAARRNALD